ncbi:AAA family ATPase [Exiguobacterium sp. s28]|uniref:AAA family ATPase n=1 Tax=Exiguobacterium sp. s28 TaxID=2751238 RepID=UPI001BEB58DB|nr:AAA family ATPase [Exiguobacterium sp. s28]
MKIEINHIGLIETAKISVNSITVIAGNNNTGKSTVGKVLYSVATGLNLLEPLKILKEKAETIAIRLRRLNRIIPVDVENDQRISELYVYLISEAYLEDNDIFLKDDFSVSAGIELKRDGKNIMENEFDWAVRSKIEDLVTNVLLENLEYEKVILDWKNDLLEVLEKSINDDNFKSNIMQKVFDVEFSQQITNINFSESDACISIQELNQKEIRLIFTNHKLRTDLSQVNTNRNFSKAIYIDDPFILDDTYSSGILRRRGPSISHQGLVRELLIPKASLIDENLFALDEREEKIDRLFSQIFNDGKLVYKGRSLYYEENEGAPLINFKNLSTGMKSFSILYMLIQSNSFDECEYIILDEPEIHLHPDWQLKYAELIVLVSKSFNLKLIITSHSPYFIEAIELYSKKHDYFDDVKFYRTVQNEKSMNYTIQDVTSELNVLYQDLAKAFYSLEELRDEVTHEK